MITLSFGLQESRTLKSYIAFPWNTHLSPRLPCTIHISITHTPPMHVYTLYTPRVTAASFPARQSSSCDYLPRFRMQQASLTGGLEMTPGRV